MTHFYRTQNTQINQYIAQRHAGKTNFSIWRHSVEQVYLGYIIITNLNTVYALLASVSKRVEVENGILLFPTYPSVRT